MGLRFDLVIQGGLRKVFVVVLVCREGGVVPQRCVIGASKVSGRCRKKCIEGEETK